MSDIWNSPTALAMLENERTRKRQLNKKSKVSTRLSFDCFNLKCRDGSVECSKGISLSYWQKEIDLLFVLGGGTTTMCRDCPYFDSE